MYSTGWWAIRQGGSVGDESVGARVGGGEPVVGEGLDQVEQLLAERVGMPLLAAALHEPLPLDADELALLLRHDLAKGVGLAME